jgi:phosphoribosylformylglycinamidine cyclo-ligase
MELYLEEKYAQSVIDIAQSFNVDARIIGRVEKSDTKKVTVKSEAGEFSY